MPLEGIVREIFEETGKLFPADQLTPLKSLWHQMDDLRLHDTGEAHFFELKVSEHFEPSNENWTENELRDTITHRWVSIDEILSEELWVGPQGAIDLLIEHYGEPRS